MPRTNPARLAVGLATAIALLTLSTPAAANQVQVIDDEARAFAGHPAADTVHADGEAAGETIYMRTSYGVTVTHDGSRLDASFDYEIEVLLAPQCVKTGDLDAYLYDAEGNLIKSDTGCDAGHLTINVPALSPGQYEVVVVGPHGVATDYTASGTLIY